MAKGTIEGNRSLQFGDLKEIALDKGPCLTITLPIAASDNVSEQDSRRLKSALQSAESLLAGHGWKALKIRNEILDASGQIDDVQMSLFRAVYGTGSDRPPYADGTLSGSGIGPRSSIQRVCTTGVPQPQLLPPSSKPLAVADVQAPYTRPPNSSQQKRASSAMRSARIVGGRRG